MNLRRLLAIVGLAAIAGALAWALFIGLPRRYGTTAPDVSPAPATQVAATSEGTRKIKAQLYYVGDDGVSLTMVEHDVPFAEGTAEQAKAILAAELTPPEGVVSAVPRGTTVRALFVTPHGEAYVDLSQDVSTAHAGGSTHELLTIYTLVNVLTTNLPAVTAVQLLVDGKEVETLAGHIDIRQPLAKNLTLVH